MQTAELQFNDLEQNRRFLEVATIGMLAMLQLFQVPRVRSRHGCGGKRGWGFPSVQQELLALRTAGPRRGAELAALRETDSLFASYIHHRLRRDLALSGCKGLHRPTRGTCTHDVHTASPSATDTERSKIFYTLFHRRRLA